MTRSKARFLSVAAAATFVLGAAQAARAQSIDYGSLEQLFDEPVTASATGSPQRATDVPVDMSIITAADIQRSGATDLPTILSRVAGVDVLNWAADNTDVGVRGYDQRLSPRLLVLIDGREVYLDDFGYTSWATLPVTLADIRQIEVVRGPNSALFGFNAVGGVINIITFNPKLDEVHSLEAHGGGQDDVGGSVVQTVRLGDGVSIRLSAGGDSQNEWRNTAGDGAAWNAHALADAVVQLAPSTELRLQGSWARSGYVELSEGYDPVTYTAMSAMATITSDTRYGNIQAQGYLNSLDNVNIVAGSGAFEAKNRVAVVSLQDLFKIGTRNTFRLAVEYRDNQENTTPLDAGRIGYGVLAPSAMWDFAATSQLSLTAAARLDHLALRRTGPAPNGFVYGANSDWNRTIDSLSANLGVVYKPSQLDTLRATYARGIQIPTLVEFGALQEVLVPGPFVVSLGGNPYLQPAVVSNYELSYDRTLQALAAKASVKVFFQQSEDVKGRWDPADLVMGAAGAEAVFENASDSTMTGFELAASGRIGAGFRWSADTTYTHVEDRATGDFSLHARRIEFARMTPAFRGNVAAGWSDAHWAADLYVHYVSAYDAYDTLGVLVTTPGYASLAARVSYLLPRGWTAAVSGQNLGAARQTQGLVSGLQAPRRVIFSLSKTW